VKFSLKSRTITASWYIEGITGFIVGEDNKMYNIATRREIKMVLNGYTKGYYLNRKFYSLTRLRPLLRKVNV
jgi:hypothetical protein